MAKKKPTPVADDGWTEASITFTEAELRDMARAMRRAESPATVSHSPAEWQAALRKVDGLVAKGRKIDTALQIVARRDGFNWRSLRTRYYSRPGRKQAPNR
jgi:hypothetical protein